MVYPHTSPLEKDAHLQGFAPSREHEMLMEVYGDHLYHNDGTHLGRGVKDNALWQSLWKRPST